MTEVQNTSPIGQISLAEIATVLRGRWKMILTVVALASVAGVTLALSLPSYYTATVTMVPASQDGAAGGSLSALASQFGGLSSLAGISLPSGGSKKDEAIATLQSRALTNQFVTQNNLLPVLFSKRWDHQKQAWISTDPKKQPSLWDAYKLFSKKIRQVREEKKSGIVTMSIVWSDPEQAALWANQLVESSNQLLQQRAVDRFTHNINFLNEQLEKTTEVEIRKSLFNLLEEQYKRLMLTKGSEKYAFQIIDSAVPPEDHSSPKRAQISVSFAFAGFMIASLWALLRRPHPSTT